MFSHCVHKSGLYVCISTAAQQTGSLVIKSFRFQQKMYNTKAFLSIRFLLVCRQGNHLTWNLAFRRHSVNVWRRKWQPSPVLLPGKSHGRRSLVSYSPWGREESDRTERLHFHFSLSCIGEGNGNPLQCPCLENPRDKGAWWAAVYGVTRSWT